MPVHRLALIGLYFGFIVMGLNGVLAKSVNLNALSITQLRCTIAVAAMVVALFLLKSKPVFNNPQNYVKTILLGMLMTIHWTTFFQGMIVSTVAIGILAHYTYPVITVLVEPLLKGEKPATTDIVIALTVLVGAAVMVPNWHNQQMTGVLFGLVSALSFSSRNILQRHWLQREESSKVMFIQVLTVAVILLPFMEPQATRNLSAAEWQFIAILGVVSTAGCHTLIAFGLRHVSAKTVGLLGCMQPPLAILFAWLLLRETPDINTFIGGGIILSAALYETVKSQQIRGQ